jgi:VWFA-related protein
MPNHRPSAVAAAIATAAVLTLTVGPRAQQARPQAPVFHTEANYVRVDVYPTKDGAPVGDLTRDDFEILDNGVPQTIDQFQHIVVQAAGPQETRREPNTVTESREMLNDPQARAFVVFLDTYHVTVGGSHNIRKPLIDALNRTIGENDLVAVMTPEMSVGDLSFARRTITIDGLLTRYWPWGERDQINSKDPEEDEYWACYPGNTPIRRDCPDDKGDRGIAADMIRRRREKRTLDALNDLVRFLRGAREERTAVIVVSSGWRLFTPDPNLERVIGCQVTGQTEIGIDPKTGKLTSKNTTDPIAATREACDRDRLFLAKIDDRQDLQRTLEEANRANVSFYPIDPRGLAVFDTPIVPSALDAPSLGEPSPTIHLSDDARMLAARIDSLRTVAEATDGLAVVNNNDLAAGMQRIVSDLTSYYLLGYYASGKLDGKFHKITVRVKRPGVQVRARRGYLAADERDVATAARAAAAKASAASAPGGGASVGATVIADAAASAVAKLAGAGRAEPLKIDAAAGWKATSSGAPAAAFWIVGEVADRIPGADLEALVTDAMGQTVASGRAHVAAGTTGALVTATTTSALAPGEYTVTLRGTLPSGANMASAKVSLPAAPQASGGVFVRRGPLTGNREIPTADLRFRRSERLTLEVPAPEATAASARLLDRNGVEVPVPVAAATHDDPDGTRWATAQLALVPLAPGDYVIEVTVRAGGAGGAGGGGQEVRTLVAFRVVN